MAFLPNAEGSKLADRFNLNRLVWSAMHSLSKEEATSAVLKWLDQKSEERVIPEGVKDILSESELHMKLIRVYNQRSLKLTASQHAVIANGKIHGPLDAGEIFTSEDFALVERLSNHQYGDKIRKVLKKYDEDDFEASVEELLKKGGSDKLLKLVSLLVSRQQSKSRFTIPSDIKDHHTVVKLPPKTVDVPYFDIFAVLDPASRGAQKLAPILILLRNVINCNLRLVLAAVEKHSDMPVKK